MMTSMRGWTRPVDVLCQWFCEKTRRTVHSVPPSAVSEDPPGRTSTSVLFTPVSPVPIPGKLSVELVPASCWCSNVRDHVRRAQWDQLRRETYRQAQYCCEICGGRGPE